MVRWLGLVSLCACSSTEISVDPMQIAWGQVDFNEARPDAGYSPINLEITNDGASEVEVVILGIDSDRLNLQGRLDTNDPPTPPPIAEGATAILTVGVWGYEPGEWDTAVTGIFQVVADDVSVDVAWSYTPIRSFDE